MKTTKYVCCVLVFACLMNRVYSEIPRNKVEQQLLDAFAIDESLKTKRPFCNAFTGCGKKRNYQENPSANLQILEGGSSVRLPLSVYKALLRAASQTVRNTIEREPNDYEMSAMPRVYLAGKMPLHK